MPVLLIPPVLRRAHGEAEAWRHYPYLRQFRPADQMNVMRRERVPAMTRVFRGILPAARMIVRKDHSGSVPEPADLFFRKGNLRFLAHFLQNNLAGFVYGKRGLKTTGAQFRLPLINNLVYRHALSSPK